MRSKVVERKTQHGSQNYVWRIADQRCGAANIGTADFGHYQGDGIHVDTTADFIGQADQKQHYGDTVNESRQKCR